MRILLVAAGGVGDAFATIAARRFFFEQIIVCDYDLDRAERSVAWIAERHGVDDRFVAARIDASNAENVETVARAHGATQVMNAVEPRFVPSVFAGALAAEADYLDMAMSLSSPHPDQPHERTGVMLGDEQFAASEKWSSRGRLALVGMGVEPGLSDVLARYASDHLFDEIDEFGVRDGANLVVHDEDGRVIFAPSFSIWTTIEECLNPPVVFERDRGWYTIAPFSEPEVFEFPEGIGPVECVNVEYEEVLLMPRWLNAKKITFKYGLGEQFIGVLRTLHLLGLDRTEPLKVRRPAAPSRSRRVTSSPPPCPIRPVSARG
ncbi:saccharopine dehydrogenase family protein [Rathayibacter rathayi]|uniref:saccharopine dehydrogenase family protein n=1 Tax=Rathayibacter rathayi TaxID=33887 RepID=UPI0030B90E4F